VKNHGRRKIKKAFKSLKSLFFKSIIDILWYFDLTNFFWNLYDSNRYPSNLIILYEIYKSVSWYEIKITHKYGLQQKEWIFTFNLLFYWMLYFFFIVIRILIEWKLNVSPKLNRQIIDDFSYLYTRLKIFLSLHF